MIFKNAMSFKSKIKQIAKEKGITTSQAQQNYLIEVFLMKLAYSEYSTNFIVKGGFLIGSLIGIDMRTTMDLDATLKGTELTIDNLERIIKEILTVQVETSFTLIYDKISEIREGDDYPGFRVKLKVQFEKINEFVTIDITTGDVITPKEMLFKFNRMFNDPDLILLTYPIETVLSEKIQTILSRGVASTRPRDYYDVYILSKLQKDNINSIMLKEAIINTCTKRKTKKVLDESSLIIKEILNSDFQREMWLKYQNQYKYARDTSFEEVVDAVKLLLEN